MAQAIGQAAATGGERRRIGRLDLVLVVACLGVVAAVAVPRQRELTVVSCRAEVDALAGSVRSAARLGHALWQTRGEPAALDAGRGRVAFVNGYPAAADLARLMEPSEAMAFRHAGGTWQHRERSGTAPCGVSYAPPPANGAEPLVTLSVGGC